MLWNVIPCLIICRSYTGRTDGFNRDMWISVSKMKCKVLNWLVNDIKQRSCLINKIYNNALNRRIFYPRSYPLHLFSYLNSWLRASISLLIFSAKQGNYWYHFYNVFGMTRSLSRDGTRNLPHSMTCTVYCNSSDCPNTCGTNAQNTG